MNNIWPCFIQLSWIFNKENNLSKILTSIKENEYSFRLISETALKRIKLHTRHIAHTHSHTLWNSFCRQTFKIMESIGKVGNRGGDWYPLTGKFPFRQNYFNEISKQNVLWFSVFPAQNVALESFNICHLNEHRISFLWTLLSHAGP